MEIKLNYILRSSPYRAVNTLRLNCFNFWVYPQRLVYIGRLKPLKMDPIEGSETSANINLTLGIHSKLKQLILNTAKV
jgi:hypothetical protein